MKVQDIRSFFKQPKTDSNAPSTIPSPVVEVPTTSRRRKEKKTKADQSLTEEDELESEKGKQKGRNKSRSVSKDEKDKERPDSSKKKKDAAQESSKDKRKSKSSEEKDEKKISSSRKKDDKPNKPQTAESKCDEQPSTSRAKEELRKEKHKNEKQRKPRVLSDSEEEEGDFNMSKSDRKSTVKSSPRKHPEVQETSKASSSKATKERDAKEKTPQKKESSTVTTSAKEKLAKYDKDVSKIETVPPKKDKTPTNGSHSSASPTKEKGSSKETSRSSTKVDSPSKKHNEKPIKESSVSKSKASSPAAEKKKVSKRPSKSIDDGSDSDDNFTGRGKAPPAKKSKVSAPEIKTPTRRVETIEEKTPEQKKEQNKSNFFKFMSRNQTPRNLGSKDIPEGTPDCLAGLTFVMTGVLDSLERDDAKEFITKHGGRVTGSISGKTSFVIVGEEAGESKLKKATTLKVPQISEDDLLEMVRKSNPNQATADTIADDNEEIEVKSEKGTPKRSSRVKTPTSTPTKSKTPTPIKKEPVPFKIPTSTSKATSSIKEKTRSPTKAVKTEVQSSPRTSTSSSTPASSADSSKMLVSVQPSTPSLMWVDKYKPKALKDVVGQAGDSSNAKKLLKWLRNWFEYHGSSADKAKASWPGLRDPEGKTFKCALLSGPPGIGKTTTAHLVCREVGYDYFEMNASDTRNKRGLKENIADALSSKCITFGNKKDELTRKHVLIMDEVDGMSGNEDRGGVQELIALIKTSRVPIICICNDRNHPKIRSLANYCFDLRFNKPTFVQLKSFMMSLCFKEKIKVLPEKLQQLIISTDQDVRQIIHQLELYKDAKCDAAYNPRKDLSFGPWDVVRKVFSAPDRKGMSIHDKTGLFFQDYSIGPLFVQDNYIRYVPQAAKGNTFKHMDILKATAESIADGDLVDSILRRSNNWSLLPVQAIFSSYAPGEYMDGHCSSAPQFPMWLGKNSNKNKRARLLQQLHSHMHLNVSGSLEALNMEYLPFLRRSIINPLVDGDIQESVQKMEDYNLIREDLDNINELSLWPGMKNNMDKVESKTKAAFTRQVNKEILPYSVVKVTKARAKGAKDDEDLEGLEDDDGAAENSEEEETLDKDAMVKVKTKTTSKKATASSSKGTSKGKRNYEDDSDEEDTSSKKQKGSRKAGCSSSKATTSKKSRK